MSGNLNGDWQARRNRFNHDWLKNKFIVALEGLVNIAEGKVFADEFCRAEIDELLGQWEPEYAAAVQLIGSFESCMSPRTLFERPPLSRWPKEKTWLPDVVNALWRVRVRAEELTGHARCQAEAANRSYEELKCLFENAAEIANGELSCCREPFGQFLANCNELSAAFAAFPHKIQVT